MAIRVEPGADMTFGIMADGSVTATHGRFQKAGADPVVRPLTAAVTAAVSERLRIPANMFDVVYPAGELNNDHMDAVVRAWWDGETIQVDLMTDATTVVADSGYAQAEHSGWTFTNEAD